MINETDHEFLNKKGINLDQVNLQLNHFKNGFPFMDIQKPAAIGDGILTLDEEQKLLFY